jgi:hypothetical protein
MSRDDTGSIAPLVPLLILALFMLGGLLVDGSRDLQARGDAQGYAEEAARAGATGIDTTSGPLKLDRGTDDKSAKSLVDGYCAAVLDHDDRVLSCGLADTSYTSSVEPTGCDGAVLQPLVVHTEVRMRIDTTLLGIVGVQKLSATGTGQAKPYEGTTTDNAC